MITAEDVEKMRLKINTNNVKTNNEITTADVEKMRAKINAQTNTQANSHAITATQAHDILATKQQAVMQQQVQKNLAQNQKQELSSQYENAIIQMGDRYYTDFWEIQSGLKRKSDYTKKEYGSKTLTEPQETDQGLSYLRGIPREIRVAQRSGRTDLCRGREAEHQAGRRG